MKKPTLKEVKKYFKYAKTVECLADKKIFEISNLNLVKNNEGGEVYYSFDSEIYHCNDDYCVCFTEDKGYAKILTKKEKTYQITKETILKYNMKDEFPDVFEVKLESGYYKHKKGRHPSWIWYIDFETLENYGRNEIGHWSKDIEGMDWYIKNNCEAMTQQEVETALKNEAVKRYKVGDYLVRAFDKSLGDVILNKETYVNDSEYYYNVQEDYLEFHGFVVYSKGQWASVLEIKTIQQAEELLKELGHEIKIV